MFFKFRYAKHGKIAQIDLSVPNSKSFCFVTLSHLSTYVYYTAKRTPQKIVLHNLFADKSKTEELK